MSQRIRVGIGGWDFAGWRGGVFYPPGLPAAGQLHYASRQLGCIEINASYYRTQSPASYARWRADTPPGFVFSVKAHRLATQQRTLLAGAGVVAHFLDSGVTELGDRLGPIVWQLPPWRAFDADDLEPFLAVLPEALHGLRLRHVLEPRHASFASADYLRLARDYGVATVCTDSPDFPQIADPSADVVYARLMRAAPAQPAGYAPAELDAWATRARTWASGATPAELPLLAPAEPAPHVPREVFICFIGAAKARNPAAALALQARLDAGG